MKEIKETVNLMVAWESIVGTPIFKNTEIISFKNGNLTIKTSNPVWRNEMFFQKKELLLKLQKEDPDLIIKKIVFI